MQYCNSLFNYSRFITREVKAGNLGIGGTNPIRIQSMTTTDTMNTIATVEQSIRMIEAGCELVRITAPSINEAKNLQLIKKELRQRGYQTPICADIHFTPNAAEEAARHVEKVRVNPGNYADKKKFESIEYTDASYDQELERIRKKFIPLIGICKEYGTAMRIGTNHGSLSDRIMSRYGDSALGMVESALEFVRICEENNFHQIVLSMKSSNTQVMIQAYRLLASKMIESGRNYPLHLGVTEAGDGEDGRIKSSVGIGTLLEDGLGDTIRVSLTEDPEFEIPVAKNLVSRYNGRVPEINPSYTQISSLTIDGEYRKRAAHQVLNLGGKNVPRVIGDLSHKEDISPSSLFPFGYQYSVPLDKWNITDLASDFIYTGDRPVHFEIPGTLSLIRNYKEWSKQKSQARTYPLFHLEEAISALQSENIHPETNFVVIDKTNVSDYFDSVLNTDQRFVIVYRTHEKTPMHELRKFFYLLNEHNNHSPVVLNIQYESITEDQFQLYSATDCGAMLTDGFADGIMLSTSLNISPALVNSASFGILQACRLRISKTEYISCPSCGRTLFDLQETTSKIRNRTGHLKGLKIGIMGCIVNGPGEMADADYGYVGSGPGKITLYKGKEVVARAIETEKAVDALIELIKSNGDWVDAK